MAAFLLGEFFDLVFDLQDRLGAWRYLHAGLFFSLALFFLFGKLQARRERREIQRQLRTLR
jgi:hypothetical protein